MSLHSSTVSMAAQQAAGQLSKAACLKKLLICIILMTQALHLPSPV